MSYTCYSLVSSRVFQTDLIFREGLHILKYRKWKDTDEKVHFESGIRMGNGMFNLVSYSGFQIENIL